MDDVTTSLGKAFQHFNAKICPLYSTKELPWEAAACCCRHCRNENVTEKAKSANDKPTKKMLNLQTYKYHSLDDYSRTIQQLGTTDSYSTTTVCTDNTLYDFDW
jgi:hypothetical protein